jgi:uncharacterized repeat protein (TIGR01451 family)
MKWFFGAALLLLAAVILESGLLAYATYVLWGALVVTRLLSHTWLDKLTATRQCALSTAEVGDKVAVTVTLHNTGAVPVPWVLAEDMLPRQALDQSRLRVKGKRLRIALLRPGGEVTLNYSLVCAERGYHQIGPLILETGDVFGLHRRFAVKTTPHFLLVCPQVVPLEGYELASRRPIGEVVLTHRLFEDPTRIAGVRAYEAGDPISRVHWRATARTGQLQCKTYEPTTLSGATILLDFHESAYPGARAVYRSELAVTAAASLASAVFEMGQQAGLVTNARDAADRIRREGWDIDPRTRQRARQTGAMHAKTERLEPIIVETRRGAEHLQRLRESLARVELTDGMTLAGLVIETSGRLPRDATLVAILGDVPVETAAALGTLRRAGFALTAVLICLEGQALEKAHGRLMAEGIRDVRHLPRREALPFLCQQQVMGRGQFAFGLAPEPAADEEGPNWARQTLYELGSPEE